jgi:hypothetical protein
MKTKDALHLPEDRLLRSFCDEDSLTPEESAHVRDCPVCSAERERIERALETMGRTAAALTPPLRRRLTLPSHASSSGLGAPIRFPLRPGTPWMIGAAAAVALLVVLGGLLSRDSQEQPLAMIQQEILDDARFLNELSELEESGLPELSVALSEESEPDEDDFLDYVVPDPDGDATTRAPGGGNRC